MDSSVIPSTTPSSSSSTESELSAMVLFDRATFMATYNRNQQWSLPDSIIYYISKNPSSAKVYGKLIQSCKYFMIRNHPIVVKVLELKQIRDKLEVVFDGERVDLNAVPSKIWITNKIDVFSFCHPTQHNSLAAVISKICQSSIRDIEILRQICSFNDLKFLGSKCENISIVDSVVMNENGSIVVFEDIFQIFPRVKDFSFFFGNQCPMMISPKTFPELIKTPHFFNLQFFTLYQLPESFDLDGFYAYIKKNKKTKVKIGFCHQISDEYCNRLQAVVDEIRADESRDYNPPRIMFPGSK